MWLPGSHEWSRLPGHHRFQLPPVLQQRLHFVFDVAHDIARTAFPGERYGSAPPTAGDWAAGGARRPRARRQMRDDDGRCLRMFAAPAHGPVPRLPRGRGSRTEPARSRRSAWNRHRRAAGGLRLQFLGQRRIQFDRRIRVARSAADVWRTKSRMICCCSRGSISPNSMTALRTRAASSGAISSSKASALCASRLETRMAALRSVLCFVMRHLQSSYASTLAAASGSSRTMAVNSSRSDPPVELRAAMQDDRFGLGCLFRRLFGRGLIGRRPTGAAAGVDGEI